MAANEPLHRKLGSCVKAVYRDPLLACYRGNPFVEALPPVLKEEQVARLLQFTPGYEESYRELPLEHRLHLVADAVRFIQPLSMYFRLEQCFSRMIRSGYVGRNLFASGFQPLYRQLQAESSEPSALPPPTVSTRGCSIVGHSGAGKSTAVNRILSMYPQVIFHGRYKGRLFTHSQIVYIKLECPYDGTLSGLCKSFFTEVDRLLDTTTYEHYVLRGRPRIDDLLLRMENLALRHSIGVLVIDEIQNLRKAKGDGANDMLDFLLWLDNRLGIPVVLVGTPKALPVLTGEFRRARRAAGQEAISWNRMREESNDWNLFTDTLWKYQYVQTNCPLTPQLRHALYYESQGIVDIAVKVYLLAQIEAMTNRTEVLTEDGLIAVAHQRLGFVQPFLADLRNNVSSEKIEAPEDLAEVNLGQIAQEELERAYACGSPRTFEEEKTQPRDAVSRDATQGETSEANVVSSPSLRKQAGEGVTPMAMPQAGVDAKRESVTPYEALKTRGYIREALEYLLMLEQR